MSSSPSPASLRLLRRFTLLALATNIGIVFSGGLVRVTGSGLGCPTWPTCDGQHLVPRPGGAHAGWQTAIEFGNRLLTFVVLAAAVAVLVQLRRTRPHPRSMMRLGWALPAGVLAQAVMGGITVLLGLTPWTVAMHFLLSMVLIAIAVGLHEYARPSAAIPEHRVAASGGVRATTTALLVVAAVVLVLGTIVTGAGPHAGDPNVARLGIDIRLAALAHADAVWLLLGLTVALVAVTWSSGPPRLRRMVRILLGLELAQGIIGYTQYALGIPEALVAIHILGAALVWAAAVSVWVRARPHPTVLGTRTAEAAVAATTPEPQAK